MYAYTPRTEPPDDGLIVVGAFVVFFLEGAVLSCLTLSTERSYLSDAAGIVIQLTNLVNRNCVRAHNANQGRSVIMRPRLAVLITIVFSAAFFRLMPHPPNLTPIAAVALFGGAYFTDKRLAFLVPLSALLVSDLVLGFYSQMPIVYISFALIVSIGLWLRQRRTLVPIAGATLASSILFYVTTNFGVWAFGSLYPKTLVGLIACYVAAIPFFHNTVLGDAVFAAVLFGGFSLAERYLPLLREAVPAKA